MDRKLISSGSSFEAQIGYSRADVAGGTPGRLALVEVIASPCARISRCNARCDVHRTPMPPSGPRNGSGTRF